MVGVARLSPAAEVEFVVSLLVAGLRFLPLPRSVRCGLGAVPGEKSNTETLTDRRVYT